MAFNDSKFGMVFPTRHGGSIGASEENRMLGALGGAGGIKTRIVNNPDGSSVMLRTRNGFPEFTYTAAPVKLVVSATDRTFVFNTAGRGDIATLYNKDSGVLKTDLVVYRTSYNVGTVHTDTQVWNDVWRFDRMPYSIGGAPAVSLASDRASFRINGKIDNVVATPLAMYYGRSALPFVCPPSGPYQGAATGNATLSTLFIGMSNSNNIGVASISKAGAESSFTRPANYGSYGQKTTAGLSVSPSGEFLVIGGLVSMYAGNSPQYVTSLWSKLQVSAATPFVSLASSGATHTDNVWEFPVSTAPYTVTSGEFSRFLSAPLWRKTLGGTFVEVTGTFSPGGSVSYSTWGHWIKNAADVREYTAGVTTGTKTTVAGDVVIDDSFTAYEGSGFDMTATRSVRGSFNQSGGWGSVSVCAYYGHVLSGTQEVTTEVHLDALQLRRLLSLRATVSKNGRADSGRINIEGAEQSDAASGPGYWKDIIGNPFSETPAQLALRNANATASYAEGAGRDWTFQANPTVTLGSVNVDEMALVTDLLATSVDYIFADVVNQVFVTLEAELSFYDSRNTSGAGSTTYRIVLKYRLQWRGVDYDFPVYDGATLAQLPAVFLETLTLVVPTSDGASADYYRGARPTPMFCPPFMSQGNCPYIAYTTKAEELAGATPELYADFTLSPMPVASSAQVEAARYAGTTIFGPVQFSTIYQRFICAESMTTHQATRNSTAWTSILFPTPTRIQFANGVKGPWQSVLGAGFSGNPATEISRI